MYVGTCDAPKHANYLELELHAGNPQLRRDLDQLLYVRVEVARWDLGVARQHGLEQRGVDEDVLVLRLDHVVALGAQAGHVTVHVDSAHVLDALQHRVHDHECARATHPRAERRSESI